MSRKLAGPRAGVAKISNGGEKLFVFTSFNAQFAGCSIVVVHKHGEINMRTWRNW